MTTQEFIKQTDKELTKIEKETSCYLYMQREALNKLIKFVEGKEK